MEQSNPQTGTIGQKFASARQAKGVSVSEAGQATRILSKFIEAMESDNFSVLSAPVYAKSFIRIYARYLNLDAQPLVDEYIQKHEPKKSTVLTEELRQNLTQMDPAPAPAQPDSSNPKKIFSALSSNSGSIAPDSAVLKKWILIGVGVSLLLLVVLTVAQCHSEDEDVPSPVAGGAASLEALPDVSPQIYLRENGKIEVQEN